MEPQTNDRRPSGAVWGILLVALGVVFLLGQLIPGLGRMIRGSIWAGAFVLAAMVFYGVYASNKQQWWALIPAYAMLAVASYIFMAVFNFPGVAIAAWVLCSVGLPFLYVYIKNNEHWWALVPAYTMFVTGLFIPAATFLGWASIVSYWNFAFALPFGVVYLRDRKQWWALIPGGIFGTVGLVFALIGIAWMIPAVMIVFGLYLLIRQSRGQKSAAPTPKYGPEADRPITEFTPIMSQEAESDEVETYNV
jgi:hypothetical protein